MSQEEEVKVEMDRSHGYAGKTLRKKCECEMCLKGLATSHNDESHDQSLFGKFTLNNDPSFSIQLVGGSTKCGRTMANYFASLKPNPFKNKKCLEVGAGTGVYFYFLFLFFVFFCLFVVFLSYKHTTNATNQQTNKHKILKVLLDLWLLI